MSIKKGIKERDSKGRFIKGNPGGTGRKKAPPDVQRARNMSHIDLIASVIEVREMTPADARKMDLEKMPLGKRVILKAYLEADYRAVSYYEDRVFGRAPAVVDLLIDRIETAKEFKNLSDAKLLKYIEISADEYE